MCVYGEQRVLWQSACSSKAPVYARILMVIGVGTGGGGTPPPPPPPIFDLPTQTQFMVYYKQEAGPGVNFGLVHAPPPPPPQRKLVPTYTYDGSYVYTRFKSTEGI